LSELYYVTLLPCNQFH